MLLCGGNLFTHPAHAGHPFAHALEPLVHGFILHLHAEAMAALGVDVEFRGEVELLVFKVEQGAGAGEGCELQGISPSEIGVAGAWQPPGYAQLPRRLG